MSDDTKNPNQPSHIISHVTQGKDGKSYSTRVAAAFPQKDGEGYTIEADLLQTKGYLSMRPYKGKSKDTGRER
jgi:hypothetical protein